MNYSKNQDDGDAECLAWDRLSLAQAMAELLLVPGIEELAADAPGRLLSYVDSRCEAMGLSHPRPTCDIGPYFQYWKLAGEPTGWFAQPVH